MQQESDSYRTAQNRTERLLVATLLVKCTLLHPSIGPVLSLMLLWVMMMLMMMGWGAVGSLKPRTRSVTGIGTCLGYGLHSVRLLYRYRCSLCTVEMDIGGGMVGSQSSSGLV